MVEQADTGDGMPSGENRDGEILGSEGSAAGGGRSDLSEWQRSAAEAGTVLPTKMPGTATGVYSYR